MFRPDRNCFGGGLYTYVKEKIASKQLNLHLDKENEAIYLEMKHTIKKMSHCDLQKPS